ncbi:hypothetical protein GCM10020295_22250 [Streptomyces cinereospinus]
MLVHSPAEEFLDADAGLAAEGVGELVGLAAVFAPRAQEFGADAGGAHREQLGADVHDPAQEALLGLHPALPAGHRVERGPGQLAGGALDVAQVRGEVDAVPELAVGGRELPRSGHQLGQPLGVEGAGLRARPGLVLEGLVRVDQVTGDREVGVDRLAGDQQVHDLGGALEDAVDAQVPQHLLGGHRPLPARPQRLGGLEAAAAADLHQFVGHQAGHLRAVQLGEGGLDADVVAVLVGHLGRQVHHGLQREGGGRDEGDLGADRLVQGDRFAPLLAGGRPLPGDLQAPLAGAYAHRGQRQPARVQGGEGDLQARALRADPVRGRHPHPVEAGDAVLQAAQAHERVAVLHGDALGGRLHDERRDAARVALGLRHAGHHDQQVGDHAVGGPELHAVEDVVVAVRDRGGGEPGRVGADVRFGQQEGGDVGAGAARQEGVLLLLGAEDLQRLRYADRLMGAQQRADGRAGGADKGEGLVVVHLRQAQPAVLRVDLHAEGAELLEPVDHVVGDPRVPLDEGGVDLRLAEVAELGEELLAALGVLVRGGRGWGWTRSRRKRPRKSSLAKLGLRQCCSRAASATWRASRSVTVGRVGAADMTLTSP